MKRRGFTFLDLLAVLFLIALIISIALPTINRTDCGAGRVKCGSNLRQIGQAILIYSNENRHSYPRTAYKDGAALTWFSGAKAAHPFAPDGPAPNDVTAPFMLLVRSQDLSPETLICPFATALERFSPDDTDPKAFSNLPGPVFLGYSLANPYPDAAARNLGYRWDATLGAEFAVAADMNPGGAELTKLTVSSPPKEMLKGNSRNEGGRAGQNVLYGDGHVEWQQNPFCGQKRDNIFTVSGSTDGSKASSGLIVSSPVWAGDSVLLPVAQIDPKGMSHEYRSRQWNQIRNWIILNVLAVFVVLVIIRANQWRKVYRARRRQQTTL